MDPEIEKLNLQLRAFFRKYDGIVKAVFVVLLLGVCAWLIIYFIDIHNLTTQMIQNPQEWCNENFPLRINIQ